MVSFEETVLPVVDRWARKCFKDEERQAVAVVLAWWAWRNRREDFPPTVYARIAVRHVLAGRDLPGVGTSVRDIWRKLVCWNGAGMGEVMDKTPGPDRLAEDRELREVFLQELSGRERRMVEALLAGTPANKLARRMHRTPARITQLRQELMRRWQER